jgi:hypothetical protein
MLICWFCNAEKSEKGRKSINRQDKATVVAAAYASVAWFVAVKQSLPLAANRKVTTSTLHASIPHIETRSYWHAVTGPGVHRDLCDCDHVHRAPFAAVPVGYSSDLGMSACLRCG